MEGYDYNGRMVEDIQREQVQQNSALVDYTVELKNKIKDLIGEFGKLPEDIKGTAKVIEKLNADMERLSKTQNDLTKNNLNIEPPPLEPQRKDPSKLNPRQQKKYQSEMDEYDIKKQVYDRNVREKRSASDDILKRSLSEIASSRSNLDLLTTTQDINKQANDGKEKEQKEPKEEGDDDNKNKNKRGKRGESLTKDIGGTMVKGMQVALLPVTATLGVISGAVTGIWNSHLMGVAKIGVLISMLVMGFDVVRLVMENLKNSMDEKLQVFGEGGEFSEGLAKLSEFWESAKNFFSDKNNDTIGERLLKLAQQAGGAILALLTDGLTILFDHLIALILNSLPFSDGKNTAESVAMNRIMSGADKRSDDDITAYNVNETAEGRVMARREFLLKENYGHVITDEKRMSAINNKAYLNEDGTVNKNRHVSANAETHQLTKATEQFLRSNNPDMNEDEVYDKSRSDVKMRSQVADMILKYENELKAMTEDKDEYQKFRTKVSLDGIASASKSYPELTKKATNILDNSGMYDEKDIKARAFRSAELNAKEQYGEELENAPHIAKARIESAREQGLMDHKSLTDLEARDHAMKLDESQRNHDSLMSQMEKALSSVVQSNGGSAVQQTTVNQSNVNYSSGNTPDSGIRSFGSYGRSNNAMSH